MTRYDFPSDRVKLDRVGSYQYIGIAPSGSLESSPVWKITRITTSGNDITAVEWADGNRNSDNVWDDRQLIEFS